MSTTQPPPPPNFTGSCPSVGVSSEEHENFKKMLSCSALNNPIKNPITNHDHKLRAVFMKSLLWPQNSTINISFTNAQPWQRAWTQKLITENIAPLVNLKFNFSDSALPKNISIDCTPSNSACSLIGTQTSSQSPSTYLGWMDPPVGGSFTFNGQTYQVPASAYMNANNQPIINGNLGGTVIHEFCHGLGMLHEHQNPSGTPIQWNVPGVWNALCGPPNSWDWQTIYNNVLAPLDKSMINGSVFDPNSIMLYAFKGALTLNYPQGTKANQTLSNLDKYWLSKNYPPAGWQDPGEPSVSSLTPSAKIWTPASASISNSIENFTLTPPEIVRTVLGLFIVIIIIYVIIHYKNKNKSKYNS